MIWDVNTVLGATILVTQLIVFWVTLWACIYLFIWKRKK